MPDLIQLTSMETGEPVFVAPKEVAMVAPDTCGDNSSWVTVKNRSTAHVAESTATVGAMLREDENA